MKKAKKNILITGLPGVGKTTLVRNLIDAVNNAHPAGFYTVEIRDKGVRKGFKLVSLDGRKDILSHVGFKTNFKVGKYSVDIDVFEEFLGEINFYHSDTKLIIIDEIGKMECFSGKFQSLLRELFNADMVVVATIALKGSGPIAAIKRRKDIKLIELTRNNRELLLSQVKKLVLGNL